MNILTLCQRGNNRSVILATILREERHQQNVISQGVFTSSQETLVMLYDWSDKILAVTPEVAACVHPEYQDKVVVINLGPDRVGYIHDPTIQALGRQLLTEAGL